MATTKYPLNGRAASIYDLITDYAESSSWPELDNQTEYEGWSLSNEQPFKLIVLNNLDKKQQYPYDIVWFNDPIYSDTLYDYSKKQYRLIQASDTSIEGQRLEIYSQDLTMPMKREYRFIIPNNKNYNTEQNEFDLGQYYYNYKCDNGEARVIYALQQIIDIMQNNTNFTYEDFLFGKENDNIMNSTYSLFKILDGETKETIKDTIITTEQYGDKELIFVNPKCYKTLGSFYWTFHHVQYNNYTHIDSELNNSFNSNEVDGTLFNGVNLASFGFNTNTTNTNINNYDTLKKVIYYIFNPEGINELNDIDNPDGIIIDNFNNTYSSNNYTNLRNNYVVKLYYYTLMFLTTQRHFCSFITSCQFVVISGITYQDSQPILRCDISLIQFIESFRVISAEHLKSTALPQSALSLDTPISIDITYAVKYRNIEAETTSSYVLTYTIGDIQRITNAQIENPNAYPYESFSFVIPGTGRAIDSGKEIIPQTDYIKFGIPPYNSLKSLGTLTFPANDVGLQLENEEELERSKNNPEFSSDCFVDTYNPSIYDTDNTSVSGITKYLCDSSISFCGMIRIKNAYKKVQDNATDLDKEEANNTRYDINVPLKRLKNYYYIKDYSINSAPNPTVADDTQLRLYYEPIYSNDDTILNSSIPNTAIDVITLKAETTDTNIKHNIDDVLAKDTTKDDKYFTVYNQHDNELTLYLYRIKQSGRITFYSSGSYKTEGNENDSVYVSDGDTDAVSTTFQLQFLNTAGNSKDNWQDVSNDFYTITSHPKKGTSAPYTARCYTLLLKLSNSQQLTNYNDYNYFRLRYSYANNYYYFKVTNYNQTINKMNIYNIMASDISNIINTKISYILYNKSDDIKNNNFKYDSVESTINPNTKAEYYINNRNGVNTYFKLTSFNYTANNDAATISRYIYTPYQINNTININSIYLAYQESNQLYEYNITHYTNNNMFNSIQLKNILISINGSFTGNIFVSLFPLYIIKTNIDIKSINEKPTFFKKGNNLYVISLYNTDEIKITFNEDITLVSYEYFTDGNRNKFNDISISENTLTLTNISNITSEITIEN